MFIQITVASEASHRYALLFRRKRRSTSRPAVHSSRRTRGTYLITAETGLPRHRSSRNISVESNPHAVHTVTQVLVAAFAAAAAATTVQLRLWQPQYWFGRRRRGRQPLVIGCGDSGWLQRVTRATVRANERYRRKVRRWRSVNAPPPPPPPPPPPLYSCWIVLGLRWVRSIRVHRDTAAPSDIRVSIWMTDESATRMRIKVK